MEYLLELIETVKKQPISILYTSLLVWISLPIIIFGIWGVVEVVFYMKLNLDIFISLFINSIIPWWASVFVNFYKFLWEYLLAFIVTTILVHHEILEPAKLRFR